MMSFADTILGFEEWPKDKFFLLEHYNVKNSELLDEKLITDIQVVIDKELNKAYALNVISSIQIDNNTFNFRFVDNDYNLENKNYNITSQSGK